MSYELEAHHPSQMIENTKEWKIYINHDSHLYVSLRKCSENCVDRLEVEKIFEKPFIQIYMQSYAVDVYARQNCLNKIIEKVEFELHHQEPGWVKQIFFRRSLLQREDDIWFMVNVFFGSKWDWFISILQANDKYFKHFESVQDI
jgi:hypothetical protein